MDILLERSIRAAKQAAEQQTPVINALITKLSNHSLRPSASLSSDLQPLSSDSTEYKELSALMAAAQAPMHSISVVRIPDREARFGAWKGTLPAHLRQTSRV